MSSLQFNESENIGGIAQLQLAPAWALGALYPITFRPGYDWEPALMLPDAAQLTTETLETDNGLQYTYGLTFKFNRNNADLLAGLRPYLGTIALAKVTDNNGFTLLLGGLQAPVTLKQNTDTGTAPGITNEVLITLSWVTGQEALIIA